MADNRHGKTPVSMNRTMITERDDNNTHSKEKLGGETFYNYSCDI